MTLKTPSVSSTRLSLPLGVAGAEPSDAAIGTLAYATDTETVRVKKAAGWADVSSGSATPTGPAGGDLAGTYPNPEVAAVHETSGPTKLTIGAVATGQLLVRSGTTLVGQTGAAPTGAASGDLAGTFPSPTVAALHETSGPTKLTLGAIANGQLLVRSGATVIGQTGAAPTGAAGGDLAGTFPSPNVAAIHETSGPTQLTFGAIATGQGLVRSGSTVIGGNLAFRIERPGWPYLEIPTSPDAWDLETRNWTNPDIAANGWTITLLDAPWTTQTRAGNVDMTSDPAANTYRSTLYGGILFMQFAPSTAVFIYKATTSAQFTYKARMWHPTPGSGTSHLIITDGPQRKAGSTRSYYIGVENGNMLEVLLVAPSSFTLYTNVAMTDNALDGRRSINNATGVVQSAMLCDVNGRVDVGITSRTVSITAAYVGISMAAGSRELCHLDFIRRTPYLAPP